MKQQTRGRRIVRGISLLILLGALIPGGILLASMESRSDLIAIGQPAPDFTATTGEGQTVRLSELRGQKRVVLVFYPGDYTPVCTAQLCSFRDNWEALQGEHTVVYGVNPANQEKHAGFAARNRLPFPLLVDAGGEITLSYGCRALLGIVKRTVYVIDRQGRVVWAKRGNPPPSEILTALHTLKD